MKTVSEIMDSFGGPVPFADFFKIPRPTAYTWERRNYLDPSLDVDVIDEASRRKIALTFEDLARLRQKKAGAK